MADFSLLPVQGYAFRSKAAVARCGFARDPFSRLTPVMIL